MLEYVRWLAKQEEDTVRTAIPIVLSRLNRGEALARVSASGLVYILLKFRTNGPAEWEDHFGELYSHFGDPDPRVRENLVLAFATMKPHPAPGVTEHFLERLSDGNLTVRSYAVHGILRLEAPPEEAIQAVVAKLEATDDPEELRVLIAHAGQARTKEPKVIAVAIKALESKQVALKMEAVSALSSIGPAAKAALPRLRSLLERGGLGLENESMIRSAIRRIGGG